MLTFNVAEPLMRRPLNVGSGSTNFGIEFPSSNVWGVVTDACVVTPSDDCAPGSAALTPQPAAIAATAQTAVSDLACVAARRRIAARDAGVLRAMGLLRSIAASSWDW